MMDNEILINQTQIFLMLLKNTDTLGTYLFSKSCRKKKKKQKATRITTTNFYVKLTYI